MNSIFKRRSIRKFKEKSVEKEKIEKLLRAAMQAPSAGNQQPWEFIVIENKENLKTLSEMSLYSKFIENAQLAFVLLANEDKMKFSENWQQDMGAATENILLEAVELDLGGVWVGVAPVEDRMNYIKQMFNLKDNLKPYCIVALGYPEDSENKSVDRFDSTRIHYEKYNKKKN